MSDRWAAIVLAGGTSSRMGRPKAWLSIAGTPMLRRVVDRIRDVVPRVVVVGAPGQDLPALPEGVVRLDDPPERPSAGPLSGIAVGLEALRTTADLAYLGSCDTPFVGAEHVRFVLQALHDAPELAAVVPASNDESGRSIVHGLSGAVRVSAALGAAQTLLRSDRRALHLLYEALPCRRLALHELPDARAVRDCDSPEQWEQARAELER